MEKKYYDVAYAESPYATLSQYMSKTFGWMFAGLLVTFAVAIGTVVSGLYTVLFGTGLIFVLTIAELVLVFTMSFRITKVQPGTAMGMFFAYAVLNGLNLSVYFAVYELPTLILAFLVGAVYFGVMALYGNRTDRDLSGWGPKLFGGLLTLLVVTLFGTLGMVFFHWNFGVMDLVISAVGLLIFMGFTAYDTQKLKYFYSVYGGDEGMLQKSAIIGALQLYLDFINIFLYVLRILARSDRD